MNEFDTVKCAQLDILKELKRICKNNNLSYCLVGGTLIGAIRHNGFIPWDDDIDVAMLREDFDRFKILCETELNPNYYYYDYHVDDKSPLLFAKLKIKNTQYTEELAENTDIRNEIFIDIFPLDNAPDKSLEMLSQSLQAWVIKKVLLLKCGYNIDKKNMISRIMYLPLRAVALLTSKNNLRERFEKISREYNDHENHKYTISLSGGYSYKKELRERVLMEDLTEHEFEDDMYSIPRNYDCILKRTYGDYMTLPSEKDRVSRHKIKKIDLGEYVVTSKLRSN